MSAVLLEWMQKRQTVHGRPNLEKLRPQVFLYCVCALAVLVWRAVDPLVQIEVSGEYERSPVVTANTVLTLLKRTGIS